MQWRKISCLFLSMLLVFPPQIAAQGLVPVKTKVESQFAVVDKLVSFARSIRTNLNRESFEFESLLEALEYDSESIIDFVKRSVTFEQYPGTLRGSKGTLQSLAGNALDQSLLLAQLLRDAGYEARITRALISKSQAQLVLNQMLLPVSDQAPIGDPKALTKAFDQSGFFAPMSKDQRARFEENLHSTPAPQASPAYATASNDQVEVLNALKGAGVSLAEKPSISSVLLEAQEYFWVQYKDGAAQPWANAHPVFAQDIPFKSPEPGEYFSNSIPERFQHRLRFQVFIETAVGDSLNRVPITEPWERPVANLSGVPLTFTNVPNSMLGDGAQTLNLEQALEKASSFFPVLDGALAPGGAFFDLNGTIIDPIAASSAAAGIFSEVGQNFRDAIEAIGGGESLPVLTAQFLQFTLISPGGDEQIFHRTTFDRLGPAARAEGHVAKLEQATPGDIRTIMQKNTFMIATGRTNRAYAMDFASESLINMQPAIEATIRISNKLPPQSSNGDSGLSVSSGDWAGFPTLLTHLDRAEFLSPSHRIYRSGPGLIIHREGLAPEKGRLAGVDIVTNPRQAIRLGGQTASLDPRAVMLAGLWETGNEGAMLPDGAARYNTRTAFEWASQNDADFIVVSPGEEDKLPPLSGDTIAAVTADLDRGYTVIIPDLERAPGQSGWWRVNPLTGETLGQFGDGRGSDATEWVVSFLIPTAVSFAFWAYGIYGCTEYQFGANGICCMTVNTLFLVAGMVLGHIVTFEAAVESAILGLTFDTASMLGWGPMVQWACESGAAVIDAVNN